MKKHFSIITGLFIGLSIMLSSCSKEQAFLVNLHGTWTLVSYLQNDGTIPDVIPGVTFHTEVTFFDCTTKNSQQNCNAVQTTTTTSVNGNNTEIDINSSEGSYQVEEKSLLIFRGDIWAVDKIDKKNLIIHKVEHPSAVYTYSKN